MTPAQFTAALTLSLAWRRRLAGQEGVGWWCDLDGRRCSVWTDPWLPSEGDRWWYEGRLRGGWAWLPSSPTAWLEATGREWGVVRDREGLRVWVHAPDPSRDVNFVHGRDPVDAALKFMLENPCPT